MGAGLRVLQKNHVVNGCCWLNHSGGKATVKFIELVRKHRCIKARQQTQSGLARSSPH